MRISYSIPSLFALLSLSLSSNAFAQTYEEAVTQPAFSVSHGLFDSGFELSITPSVAGREIRYTTDCSEPTLEAKRYERPITVSNTMVVRAAEVVCPDSLSDVTTATYIFPTYVIRQACSTSGKPVTPSGYPSSWGKYDTMSGTAPAYYAMDSEIVNESTSMVLAGFQDLPIVSLVTDKNNLFSKVVDPEKGGIYIYTGSPESDGTGRDWERPVSVELIGGALEHDLTVDCGIKLHGGHSRLPEKNPKHAFKLRFKSKYGVSKLHYPVFGEEGVDKYEDLVLRTFFGNAWQHWSEDNRTRAQYTRDLWARSIQERLGHPHSKGQTVHLFLNGMYWGMYNLCERVTAEHCATHYGGKEKHYDVIKVEETLGQKITPADGTLDTWQQMVTMVGQVSSKNNEMLYRLEGRNAVGQRDPELEPMLDIEAFCDYMLINFYAGNTDWDHHNWFAFRSNHNPDHGFRFLCWDTELIFGSVNENVTTTNHSGMPTGLLRQLMRNSEFKQRFNHRAHVLLTDDGILTPNEALEVWDSLYHIIDRAIYDESARWGVYRRDIHPYQTKGHRYRVDTYYQNERNRLLTEYFPRRTSIVIDQLRKQGWYTNDDPWASIREIETLPAAGSQLIYTLQGQPCGQTDAEGNLPAALRPGIYVVGTQLREIR